MDIDRSWFLQEVFNSIDTGLIGLDAKFHVVLWNSWIEASASIKSSDVIGKSILQIFPDLDYDYLRDATKNAVANDGPVEISKVFLRTSFLSDTESPDDGLARYSIKLFPLFIDRQHQYVIQVSKSTLSSLHDQGLEMEIDRLRQRQKKLAETKQAVKLKTKFLTGMSHETRTLMNGVIGISQLLGYTKLTKKQKEYLDIIDQSSHRLLTVINKIIDFQKIESGNMPLDPVSFDLEKALLEVMYSRQQDAEIKSLELILDYQPDVPRNFYADVGKLRQIVSALIDNAIKFTDKGNVIVRVSTEGHENGNEMLHVAVEDTGIGIDNAILPKLFDAFDEIDDFEPNRLAGTSLDLAFTRKIVNLMDGKLGVDSEPGKGSRFWVRFSLPLGDDMPVLPQTDLHGMRVLVVDDNAVNLVVLCQQLRAMGLYVEPANGGRIALIILKNSIENSTPFDLIITDFMMPGMNGDQLAREIKSDDDLKHIPLILLSSVSQIGDESRFSEMGFSAYLTKPEYCRVLRQTIEAVIGYKQSGIEQPGIITRHIIHETEQPAVGESNFVGKVLLVEDVVVNQIVSEGMLRTLGLNVDIASNGQEAFYRWKQGSYNLVLMDCQMPVLDGYEATRLIRQHEANNRIPIIAITANATQEDRDNCHGAGMDDCLVKPFEFTDLIAIISKWLPADKQTSIGLLNNDNAFADSDAGFDKSKLADLENVLGPRMLDELIKTYVVETGKYVMWLSNVSHSAECSQFERAAHSMKSSSMNIGAHKLAAVAEELETKTRMKSFDNLEFYVVTIKNEFERVCSILSKLYPDSSNSSMSAKK